jgi:hypothetical protein
VTSFMLATLPRWKRLVSRGGGESFARFGLKVRGIVPFPLWR